MSVRPRQAWRAARRGPESGAAAVEMALVAPVFIALLFATFELGWAAYCGATVRFAVQRAARMLIANPETSASSIQNAAQARLSGVPINNLSISLDTEAVASGEVVRVSWRYTYDTSLPFVPATAFRFDSSTLVPVQGS